MTHPRRRQIRPLAIGAILGLVVLTACDPVLQERYGGLPVRSEVADPAISPGTPCPHNGHQHTRAADGSWVTCTNVGGTFRWQRGDQLSPVKPLVLYYYDSLGVESIGATRLTLGDRVELVSRGYSGTAICDWYAQMRGDIRTWQPELVVFEFIGNSTTDCVTGGGPWLIEPAAIAAIYDRDAQITEATLLARGIDVLWIGGPRSQLSFMGAIQDQVEAMYAHRAQQHPRVSYVDSGRAIQDDSGNGVSHMPCAPWETAAHGCDRGQIRVRSTDGVHLQVPGPYSSGAFRFGTTVAHDILAALP